MTSFENYLLICNIINSLLAILNAKKSFSKLYKKQIGLLPQFLTVINQLGKIVCNFNNICIHCKQETIIFQGLFNTPLPLPLPL